MARRRQRRRQATAAATDSSVAADAAASDASNNNNSSSSSSSKKQKKNKKRKQLQQQQQLKDASNASKRRRGNKNNTNSTNNTNNTNDNNNNNSTNDDDVVRRAEELLGSLLEQPEEFFMPSEQRASRLAKVTKCLYDHAQRAPKQSEEHADSKDEGQAQDAAAAVRAATKDALDELIVDGFDTEQVWAELQLRNEPLAPVLDRAVESLEMWALDDEAEDDAAGGEDGDDNDDDDDDDAEDSEDDDPNLSDDEVAQLIRRLEEQDGGDRDDDSDDERKARKVKTNEKKNKKKKKKKKKSPKANDDDPFFDMEEMLRLADGNFNDPDDEGLDMDDDDDDDDDNDADSSSKRKRSGDDDDDDFDPATATYADFFKPPSDEDDDDDDDDDDDEASTSSSSSDSDDDDDSDDSDDDDDDKNNNSDKNDKNKSRQELAQERMQEQIRELEQQIVRPRDWDQIGEVTASKRPADSLLETHLDFDYAGRAPEPVTEETTRELEDIIRQRILDEAWDDPVRRQEETVRKYKPRAELSQEKSALGLAEVYEKDFVDKAAGRTEDDDLQDELAEEHAEIARLFAKLCHKLDSLSNFHFTPKPVVHEIQPRNTTPAIQMEEVLPMGVSKAQATAPQEVFASESRTGDIAERAEQTREEKKRRRAARRKRRGKKIKERTAKEKALMRAMPHVETQWQRDQMAKQITRDKNTTTNAAQDATQYGRSKAFFKKLTESKLINEGNAKHRKGGKGNHNDTTDADEAPGRSANFKL